MNIKYLDEDEDFGAVNNWRLISRSVVDGQRCTVRAMCVQGRGALIQTSRQVSLDDGGWSQFVHDDPLLVEGVLLIEFLSMTPSLVTDGAGEPVSVTRQIQGRELVSTAMAKEKFKPKKKGGGGEYDHLDIRAGAVLTLQTDADAS